MADQITNCITLWNPDDSVGRHLVYYSLDDGSGNVTSVEIVVGASEMTDPNSHAELSTKADIKAAAYKGAWLTAVASEPTVSGFTDLNGPVTL